MDKMIVLNKLHHNTLGRNAHIGKHFTNISAAYVIYKLHCGSKGSRGSCIFIIAAYIVIIRFKDCDSMQIYDKQVNLTYATNISMNGFKLLKVEI